jgi:hypothetical protein
MGNSKSGNRPSALSASIARTKRSRWISLFVIVIGISIIFVIARKTNQTPAESNQPAVATDTTSHAVEPQDMEKTLQLLVGKWQRTDGGYIIELNDPGPDGKIQAAYFNPKPIHVGSAGWQFSTGKIIVTVELQDVNYPRSLYTLEYFPKEDVLEGSYFQAVERVNHTVDFRRVK